MTDGDGYTIDELAAATGVPSRTIRFYQAKGALPAPEKRGRVAYYGDSHVERLRLIGELQDRGLRLSAIRDLIRQSEEGDLSVREWLGFGQKLGEPWSHDRPRVMTEAEIDELIGGRPPGTKASLVRGGFLERRGDGIAASYLVASPALLDLALRLDAGGVDVETASGAGVILRKRLGQAADELVDYFVDRAGEGFGRRPVPEDLASALDAMRPAASEAAQVIFAQEVERALRSYLESGKRPPTTKRKG